MNHLAPLLLLVTLFFPISGHAYDYKGSSAAKRDTGYCLTCHDGTVARNIFNIVYNDDPRTAADGSRVVIFRYPGNDKGHPVGINYLEAMIKSRGRLRPPSSIDPAIKLENGYVGCTTCHDPNSRLRARLVMSNEGSRLCLACHDL